MTLPIPTKGLIQRRFGGPDAPVSEQGDCWATVVASYAGLGDRDRNELHRRISLSALALRRAGRDGNGEWWAVTGRFLTQRGLPELTATDQEFVDAHQEHVYIASGPSPRGDFLHAVLAVGDGQLFWDPHPSGDGVDGIDEWIAWWRP